MMKQSYISLALLFAISCGQAPEDDKASVPEVAEEKIDLEINSAFNATQPTGRQNYAWDGQFSTQFNFPLIPLHAVLMPDGKVFSYGTTNDGTQSGQFNYDIWNPAAGTENNSHQWMPNNTRTDTFCSAAALLPNGDVLVPGGDTRNPVNFGIKSTLILNNNSKNLAPTAQMNFARWYPTATTLPNGETMIHGGKDGNGAAVNTPEVFNNGQWRTLWGASNEQITSNDDGRWNYPRNWVSPQGRVFGLSGNLMYYLDWGGNGGSQTAGFTPNKTRSYVSTAVMYQPGKILQVGGTVNGDVGARGSNQAITIDINSGWPAVQNLPNMAKERIWGNSTVLPNGEVLISGGSAFENKIIDPAQVAEIWNPNTRQFRQVAKAATPRLYHSISLLLPDATVLVGGGGAPGPLNNLNAEIYYPPYLYDGNGNKAQRLTINNIGNNFKYNNSYNVKWSGAGNVQRVTLIRTGAVTHSFDMSQRFLELGFTRAADGSVNIQMPNNANIAPPGYYLVFLVNQNGTPSVGKIVGLNANGGSPVAGSGGTVTPPAPTPPAPGGAIAAGNVRVGDVLQISHRNSGKCLDVPASSAANSVKLQQYDCNGTNAQKWKVEQGRNGAFLLKNVASNKCMDITSAGTANTALMQQYDCWDGSPSQNWKFDASTAGSVRIHSTHSDKCLEIVGASKNNSAQIQQWSCVVDIKFDWFLNK